MNRSTTKLIIAIGLCSLLGYCMYWLFGKTVEPKYSCEGRPTYNLGTMNPIVSFKSGEMSGSLPKSHGQYSVEDEHRLVTFTIEAQAQNVRTDSQFNNVLIRYLALGGGDEEKLKLFVDKIERKPNGELEARGQLTINDVMRPVWFPLQIEPIPGGESVKARFEINRHDWDIKLPVFDPSETHTEVELHFDKIDDDVLLPVTF